MFVIKPADQKIAPHNGMRPRVQGFYTWDQPRSLAVPLHDQCNGGAMIQVGKARVCKNYENLINKKNVIGKKNLRRKDVNNMVV